MTTTIQLSLAIGFTLDPSDAALSSQWSEADREALMLKARQEIWLRIPEDVRDEWTALETEVQSSQGWSEEAQLLFVEAQLVKLNERMDGFTLELGDGPTAGLYRAHNDETVYAEQFYSLDARESGAGGEPAPWKVEHRPPGQPNQALPLDLCLRWQVAVA